ncbi:MAG: potassium uptake protein, TrkH family [Firmicutes bacterium]|nr:potassium uptake protein, TrkH family [Bacillota bacterium]
MNLRARLAAAWLRRQSRISPTRLIAIVFVLLIALGTLLLMLPAASRAAGSCGVRQALFTATSATCVTGLVLGDTWSLWTGFGQVVILCLIEVGGLGFISAASLVIFLLRRRVGMRERMLMAQALSVSDLDSVVRLQKDVLIGSLSIQSAGALILFLRFLPRYGPWRALRWGVFHAVSAFCNAGFDIWGCLSPGESLAPFRADPVVSLTLCALIVLGGLGFFVWEELWRLHSWKKFSVYTKLVLLSTAVLIAGGALGYYLLERDNPATFGGESAAQVALDCLFQSISTRTAGFASFDQGSLTEGGKGLTVVLMLIGGSSGSTAGGLKTVTIVVLLLFLRARIRGTSTVRVFRRTVPDHQVMNAMCLVGIVALLAIFGTVLLCATSPVSFIDALYETVSALATVGLSTGVTASLSAPAQYLLILYMYFGRVGVLTLSLGFLMGSRSEDSFRYAYTNLLIG